MTAPFPATEPTPTTPSDGATIYGDGDWWWLSFCDADRPGGMQFLGACLVQGFGQVDAISNAWAHGINPGGEVLAVGDIPPERAALVPARWTYRLLSKDEADQFDREMMAR